MPASVPTEYKRQFLRSLLWDSLDNGETLAQTLKNVARARLAETNRGKVLINTAANGKSATYQIPPGYGITPADITCLCEELLTRYDEAFALIDARQVPAPTDQQIHDEILALMQPIHEASADFSFLPR